MNQLQLRDKLLEEILAICNGEIAKEMTMDTYAQTIAELSMGSMLHICEAANRVELYEEFFGILQEAKKKNKDINN